jgi:hypothetical protein
MMRCTTPAPFMKGLTCSGTAIFCMSRQTWLDVSFGCSGSCRNSFAVHETHHRAHAVGLAVDQAVW